MRVIEEVRALADESLVGSDLAPKLDVRMTGVAYLSAFGLDTFVWDLLYSLITAFAVIFVVLMLVFRSPLVGLLALLPNLLPLAITLAAVPLFGYGLNTTTAVVFTITIGLAVDNTIHIIARFKGEWLLHQDIDASIRAAFSSAGRAIVLSNLLLMGGLSVLDLSDFEPLRRISLLAITTISAALFAAMLVLPAELKLLGLRIVDRARD
jgi:predicted RND superfamily exporter protein